MTLETASFVSGLDSTQPPSGDPVGQGDDHLRLIKAVLQGSFPNADRAFYGPRAAVKTATYNVLAADNGKTFLADLTGGTFNFNLPTLGAGDDGWSIRIIKVDATTTATFIIGTINGVVNPAISRQYQSGTLVWSGTAWYAWSSVPDPGQLVSKDTSGSSGPSFDLFRDSSSPAVDDLVGEIILSGRDGSGNKVTYGRIAGQIKDPVVASGLDGQIYLDVMVGGALTNKMILGATFAFITGGIFTDGAIACPALSATGNVNGATVTGNSVTASGALSGASAAGGQVANQAEQETGSATDRVVSPGRQQFHKSAAKAWGQFTLTGTTVNFTSSDAYNVSGVVRNGVGVYTISFSTAFSNTNYTAVTAMGNVTALGAQTKNTGSYSLSTVVPETGGAREAVHVDFVFFGDQ